MVRKRSTPPDDSDRLAENLFNFDRNIIDKQSFNEAYDKYLTDSPEAVGNAHLRDMTFNSLRKNHRVVKNENLHTKAGGKSLRQDRRTTAKTVVKTRKEYIKQGASKVDLKNYDTIASRKGTIIFARKSTNKSVKGKVHMRLRDTKGRFVSRQEKK